MKLNEQPFFKPHIGEHHEGRLILLATTCCPHPNCLHWQDCTNGKIKNFTDCKYPDFDLKNNKVELKDTVKNMVDKFIEDRFGKGEKRYKTFSTLTNAISLSIGGSKLNREQKREIEFIWNKFICTELCQHFIPYNNSKECSDRNSIKTSKRDFEISNSYSKLLSLISNLEDEGINIKKIMILGQPAFLYLKKSFKKDNNPIIPIGSNDGYWHKVKIFGKDLDILYTWHPSYSKYYDRDILTNESLLIPELAKFFG